MIGLIREFGSRSKKEMEEWHRSEASTEDVVTHQTSYIEIAVHIRLGNVCAAYFLNLIPELCWTDA